MGQWNDRKVNIVNNTKNLLAETFISLKHDNYRYFLSGQSVSLIGTWMQRTAQQWLVYTLTDSAFLLGLLGVCQFAPMLLFSLLAGVYVDRIPKKSILLLTQVMQMVQALTLATLVWLGIVEYWHVFILAAIFGLANTFEMPTRHSFIIEMVGRNNLKNAIGLNSTMVNIARIIGPGLAGITMARFGIAFCFFINGISYLAVIFSLLKIHVYTINIRIKQQNITSEILDGLNYIRNQKQILYPVMAMLAIGTFAMNTDVIIPVFAKVILSQEAQGYSFLLSAIGVGALIGSLFFAARSQKQSSRNGIVFSASGVSICLFLAGMTSNYYHLLGILVLFGVFSMIFMTTVNSTIQLNSNDEYRGRVMSVYSMVFVGTTPIGNFLTGYIAQNFGPANSFYFCGVVSILLIAVIYIRFGPKRILKERGY